jgi:hypothetical protein
MSRIFLAFRVFVSVLFNSAAAQQVSAALAASADGVASGSTEGPPAKASDKTSVPTKRAAAKPAPARSEALTLLATLQREARLVDFLQEPLDDYSDAQIGAAVRDVHRHAAEALQRLFALQPVAVGDEGSQIDVPEGDGATRFHLIGAVGAAGARRGSLRHKGWQATRCQLPLWTGEEAAKLVVAPAEVELT